MHVTGAHRPDEAFAVANPPGENDEKLSAFGARANRFESFLAHGVSRVGGDHDGSGKRGFDLGNRNAAFLAFPSVALIPVKTRELHCPVLYVYHFAYTNVNTIDRSIVAQRRASSRFSLLRSNLPPER
jgi:hypothetical protein